MIYILIEPGENLIEQFFVAFSRKELTDLIKEHYQKELVAHNLPEDKDAWKELKDGVLGILQDHQEWEVGKYELFLDNQTFLLIITDKPFGFLYE